MEQLKKKEHPGLIIEKIKELKGSDLVDLCDATDATIKQDALSFTIGLNRAEPPVREILESYWKGVLLVPERTLIVGRIDNVIASSIQLIKAAPGNQTSSFSASVENHFVAPWARGFGLAKELLKFAEKEAKQQGVTSLRINVRESFDAAIKLYESHGYKKWGTLNKYEQVGGKMYAGYFYSKDL